MGKELSQQQWDSLPMPYGVITTVKAMAEAEDQPLMGQGNPLFELSPSITRSKMTTHRLTFKMKTHRIP
eukprot:CAMPEP_0198150354 /NCGR_PEP_ID=MMETSP1443-20131203/50552_1 /TAXON_ID=186043 /ORGANISM="Entomoneis sp., Strain CCMP2396" /LENGTH=68 /DNA_ID=CAMNT_0043815633 /DNA_START=467 /DNA_END=670 /DNA_ORIENTATION=-